MTDTQQIAQRFNRQKDTYAQVGHIQQHVAIGLAQKVFETCPQAHTIADFGAGTGFVSQQLTHHYPKQAIIALDIAAQKLAATQTIAGVLPVCADAQTKVLRSDCLDVAVSSLMLQWLAQPSQGIAAMRHALKPQGHLFLATFGAHTLHELRQSWAQVDGCTHVNTFLEADDLNQLLLKADFSDIVIEKHHYHLTFATPQQLAQYLKLLGANYVVGQTQGLCGKQRYQKMVDYYQQHFPASSDGAVEEQASSQSTHSTGIIATFEVLVAHAIAQPTPQRKQAGQAFGIPVQIKD